MLFSRDFGTDPRRKVYGHHRRDHKRGEVDAEEVECLCDGESVGRALKVHVDQTAQRGERRVEARQLENELKHNKKLEPERRLGTQEVFVSGYMEVAQLPLDIQLPGTRHCQSGIHQHGDRDVE
ncbi:hypothetical protein KL930_001508 [Ogataea haglerorum]|uniref:Uncharacterized protein n=1 Tax=Ogataea haglerorum TaxID=1937702 RepID=A0AAN6D1G0_9ASCO|nr:uncharacterized protein KL911_004354 [Ogataea haglerorum]KAG7698730.1 hypothetical protein KL951_001994 [Ogataea haglerorum]KAG7703618.1 hypothetical protein KL914_004575 [Ogataea haglerorum]KAG7704135.1 hypothetical protein KL950_004462 [Ogataea haglerorum]KAG7713964.1 hypothetical protein KL913_004655 [Ogataea haglerorum]KAG7714458.1 hypothetical protein KL949_004694 [Ogataea haglerorum]